METTTNPVELAKLHEAAMLAAHTRIDTEQRCVERLLIGLVAMNRAFPRRGTLIITAIKRSAHGSVQVWGKKRPRSDTSHLIGGLGNIELVHVRPQSPTPIRKLTPAKTTRFRPQRRASRCQPPQSRASS